MRPSIFLLFNISILMPLGLAMGEANVLMDRNPPQDLANSFRPRGSGPQVRSLEDPKTLSVTCDDSVNEDGSTERSILVTDRSSSTGHTVTLRIHQKDECHADDCDTFTSQELFYDNSKILKESSFSSGGVQNVTVSWGELVRGVKTAQYIISKEGIISGYIDDHKLRPFTAEDAKRATFADGTPIPAPVLPQIVNDTLTSVTPGFASAISQCGPKENGIVARGGGLQIRSPQTCVKCLQAASAAFGVATAVCVASFSWWNWIGLAICEAAAAAVLLGLRGNCFSHKQCP